MYLKEAFQYQNYLSGLFENAVAYLGDHRNTTIVTQLHKRKQANPNAEDLVRQHDEIYPNSDPRFPVENVLMFIDKVLEEREHLALAIDQAKLNSGFDMDAAIALNKDRQRLLPYLSSLVRKRLTTTTSRSSDYMVNVEGNQVSYSYEVEETYVPSFNADAMRIAEKNIRSCCQRTSDRVERYLLTTEVDLEPSFVIDEHYLDAMTAFMLRHESPEDAAEDDHYVRHAV